MQIEPCAHTTIPPPTVSYIHPFLSLILNTIDTIKNGSTRCCSIFDCTFCRKYIQEKWSRLNHYLFNVLNLFKLNLFIRIVANESSLTLSASPHAAQRGLSIDYNIFCDCSRIKYPEG